MLGLFMLGGDIPPAIFMVFTNIYPLVWLVATAASAVLVVRRRRARGRPGERIRPQTDDG